MSLVRLRSFAIALLVSLVPVPALDGGVQELAVAVQRVWDATLAGAPADPDAAGIHLELPGAVDGRDLELLLRRWHGSWSGLARLDRSGLFTIPMTVRWGADEGERHALTVTGSWPDDRPTADTRAFGVLGDCRPGRRVIALSLDLLRTGDAVSGVFSDGSAVQDRCRGWWDDAGEAAFLCTAWSGALRDRDLAVGLLLGPSLPCSSGVQAPRWNKGRHALELLESDAEGSAGRLLLQGDGWVPKDQAHGTVAVAVRWQLERHGDGRVSGSYEMLDSPIADCREGPGDITGWSLALRPMLPTRTGDPPRDYLRLRAVQAALAAGLPPDAAPAQAWSPVPATAGGDWSPASLAMAVAALSGGGPATVQGHAPGPDACFTALRPDEPALAGSGPGATPLPDTADGWQQLSTWRNLGPWSALPELQDSCTALPPLLPAGPARDGSPLAEATLRDWVDLHADAAGRVGPGLQEEGERLSGPVTSYLTTRIDSASAGPGWLHLVPGMHWHKFGGNCRARIRLWIDGTLRWVSDDPEADLRAPELLLPMQWRRGSHQVLLELSAAKQQALWFRCRLRRAGQPRDAAQLTALDEQRRERLAAAAPLIGRGYRGDYNGTWPATPEVAAWNMDSGVNVRWQVAMPAFSNAMPLPVGDALFVHCEPHHLLCLDADSGAERWRAIVGPMADWPAAERQEAEALLAEGSDPKRQDKAAAKRIAELYRALQAAEEAGDRAQVVALTGQLATQKEGRAEHRAIAERARLCSLTWGNFMGQTFATPGSDGRCVVSKNASGAVACFELDGRRRWQHIEDIEPDVYQTVSPVIVDDLAICCWTRERRHHGSGVVDLVAHDLADGTIRWRCSVANERSAGGTPVPMRLSDGARVLTALVLANGGVVAVDDGGILNPDIGQVASGGWTSVSVHDDLVVVPLDMGRLAALRLHLQIDGEGRRVLVEPLWEPIWWGGGSHHFFTGDWAVLHDGTVFTSTIVKEHELKSPVGWQKMDLVDLASGALRRRVKPIMRDVGEAYTPPGLAGDRLFLVDSGNHSTGCFDARPGGAAAASMIGVVDADSGQVIATNPMYRMQAPPAFADGRIYVRTDRAVLCLELAGEEGRRYQQGVCARQLFDELARWPEPVGSEPLAIAPSAPHSSAAGEWALRFEDPRTVPGTTSLLLCRDCDEAAVAALPAGWLPVPGAPVGDGVLTAVAPGTIDGGGLADLAIDLVAAIGPTVPGQVLLSGILDVGRERVVEGEFQLRGRIWLGSTELQPGVGYRLVPGRYALRVFLGMERRPPPGMQPVSHLRFIDRADPARAWRDWHTAVVPYAARLRQVLVDLPRSPEAARAERMLDLLQRHGP